MFDNWQGATQTRYLSPKELCKRWNLSRTTLYRGVKQGRYPASVQISPRRVGYLFADVEQCERSWQKARSAPEAE